MLTPLSENGVKQCHLYWPDEGADVYHIYEVRPSQRDTHRIPTWELVPHLRSSAAGSLPCVWTVGSGLNQVS